MDRFWWAPKQRSMPPLWWPWLQKKMTPAQSGHRVLLLDGRQDWPHVGSSTCKICKPAGELYACSILSHFITDLPPLVFMSQFVFDLLFFFDIFQKNKNLFLCPSRHSWARPTLWLSEASHEVNQKSSTNLQPPFGDCFASFQRFPTGVPWRLSALGVHKLDCLPNGEPLTTPATGVGCGLDILWYSWTQQELSYVGIEARNESWNHMKSHEPPWICCFSCKLIWVCLKMG